ncbi:MAG: hypothetical protein BWY42_01702 [Candidatus Omnitrophica bacterium ADurb.Bin277]|nr:MAG: hypothetical protein BWY42_01702 [Candidatus Omnitrophica bacterium ADurb.Bin277]
MFLVKLDVRHKPRPGITPFQEIMAQYQVFREAVFRGFFKGINVVEPFPDKRPLKKQVLVNIGNRLGIRINSVFAAKNPHKK